MEKLSRSANVPRERIRGGEGFVCFRAVVTLSQGFVPLARDVTTPRWNHPHGTLVVGDVYFVVITCL